MSKPLYKKIIDDLLHAIETGNLQENAQLPTEKELSQTYNVSRITSKRALTELENQGLIYRIQGRGSYVQKRKPMKKKVARILFLIPFVNDLSLGNFNEGLAPVTSKHQYEVIMSSSEFLINKKAADIIEDFDGMIYYAHNTEDFLDTLFELSIQEFPVIILDKKIHDLSYPTVQSDNFSGGVMATTYLAELGHQRIAYIFGETTLPQSVRQRYLGYIHATKEQHLSFHTALTDKQSFFNADVIHYLHENAITGVVCENDLVAISLMNLAKRANIDIPNQLSVVGFDNIQAASLIDPSLTTIAQDFKGMGTLAGTMLIDWIEKHKVPTDQQIPVKQIIRHSTKENQ
ncbi:GntR family transcriptional regulator [Enterococcus sp. AZ101]|uniref:GntR family transcriptional regulator n=1 Tax=Enterococcus sp. AZ101 TaxID=2774742 RepID=UPI003D284322